MTDTIRFNTRAADFDASRQSAGRRDADERLTKTGRIVHDARGNAIFLLAGEDADDVGASGLMRRLDVPELSLEGSELRRLGATSSFQAANAASGFDPYDHSASDTMRVQSLIDRRTREKPAEEGTATMRILRLLKVR